MNIEDIRRKLAALLAKAHGTDNMHEAEAFLAKVQELMEKYQLDLHDLHEDDPLGNEHLRCTCTDAWIYRVIAAAARYWGAKVIWEKNSYRQYGPVNERIGYRIFGPESARVTHVMMLPYLLDQVRYQGRIFAKDHGVSVSIGCRHVGMAFAARLHQLADETKVRHDSVTALRALVPVNVVDQLVKEFYNKLGSSPAMRSRYSSSAVDYANKISLAQQVSGVGQKRLK